jgi:glycosyltransferase involved in cell wall biosynthesis
MKILFATGHAHLPALVGGLQTTLHELCLALGRHGTETAVLCGTLDRDAGTRCDRALGYPVLRSPDPVGALGPFAAVERPDALVVLTGAHLIELLLAGLDCGLPVAAYLHNVEYRELGGVLLPDPSVLYLANSQFTSRRLKGLFGIDTTVIYPLVDPERYRLQSTDEKLLFINPTQLKGLEIVLAVARALPEVSFRIAESWHLPTAWRDHCRARAGRLGNVDWLAPTRYPEELYGSARLLLMPSIWEEAFGRSALEAQHAGVPVLASERGGLPEAVGDGGELLPADAPVETWIQAITRLLDAPATLAKLASRARAHAEQQCFRPETIVDALLGALQRHVAAARR